MSLWLVNGEQKHASERSRGRENPRCRGGRHQSHFVEINVVVPQEPAIDYLFMAIDKDVFAF